MKKLLIPILSMTAVVPAVTSAVACSSKDIKLKFHPEEGGGYFYSDEFNITANKKYTFVIDMADANEAFLEDEVDKIIFTVGKSDDESFAKIDKNTLEVKRNDKVIESTEVEGGSFVVDLGDDFLEKTDKFYVKVSFLEDFKKATAVFMEHK